MQDEQDGAAPDFDAALDDDVGDDLLRLIFMACHDISPRQYDAPMMILLQTSHAWECVYLIG